FPGLVDIHLHLNDLFEVTTDPIPGSVADGVTVGLTPGAGNTLMAPSLLGAEVDRGLPMNVGAYLGCANVLATRASVDELIQFFKGELPEEVALEKISRNPITVRTAPLTVGFKDHMAHFIQPDEALDKCFEISSKAGLLFMSHCQDPSHSERVVSLSKGRPVHLGHANIPGCGTHGDPVEAMQVVVDLVQEEHVTGEFITTMLRPALGSRECLFVDEAAQQVAYDALSAGDVEILISDGQLDATMKGGGDTRDNVPCLLELVDLGVLSLSQSVATMTANPVRLLAERTRENWWLQKLGHLGAGALANVTIVNPINKLPTYTLVNGVIAGFENRTVRAAHGAGRWVSKYGMVARTGVGDMAMFQREGVEPPQPIQRTEGPAG
ncbi:MAG TPA: hydrolase, partial [bacterium]|nr:hydrolase [bacterium]